MKITDFAKIQYSKTGKKRIIAYHIFSKQILHSFFKQCNYKQAILAEKLNIHYQSMRVLLNEVGLWNKVKTRNGRGIGLNRKRSHLKNKQGYLYSKNIDSYKITGQRSRRKLEHIEKVENKIKRELKLGEIIHHIDCNKENNLLSNLFLCSKSEHGKIHKNLEQISAHLVKNKLVKFNRKTKKYYMSKKLKKALDWK